MNPGRWCEVLTTPATRCRLAEFREVYPGVLSLALPLPFELESVNVYLVELDEGWLLIDCGMETDRAFETLAVPRSSGAESRGATSARSCSRTCIPDHMGMSARLLELTGAELAMHEAEAEHLKMVREGGQRLPWLVEAYRQAAVPKALEAQMESHFFHIRKNFHDLTPDQLLVGGEEFGTAIGRLVVCWTSGHSPGHVCLHSPERRLLFSGDQILPGITPNIAWHPGRDMLAEFLESLDRLAALEVDLIFPGHGEPFSGHRAWVAETIGHHGQRCDEIFNLLRKSPRSVHSMVGDLWRRPLSPINHHFAVFEVLAHLEYMQRQGRVGYRQSNGGVEWHA